MQAAFTRKESNIKKQTHCLLFKHDYASVEADNAFWRTSVN